MSLSDANDLDISLTTAGTLTIRDSIVTTVDGNITLNNTGQLAVNAAVDADGDVRQNRAGTTALDSDINTS